MGAGGPISLAVLSAVIAAVAAAVAIWRSYLAGKQAREARKSRELSAVISLFNAHQSEDASRIRCHPGIFARIRSGAAERRPRRADRIRAQPPCGGRDQSQDPGHERGF